MPVGDLLISIIIIITWMYPCMLQGRRNDFLSRGAWSLRSGISSGRNSEKPPFYEKVGAVPSEPPLSTTLCSTTDFANMTPFSWNLAPFMNPRDTLSGTIKFYP